MCSAALVKLTVPLSALGVCRRRLSRQFNLYVFVFVAIWELRLIRFVRSSPNSQSQGARLFSPSGGPWPLGQDTLFVLEHTPFLLCVHLGLTTQPCVCLLAAALSMSDRCLGGTVDNSSEYCCTREHNMDGRVLGEHKVQGINMHRDLRIGRQSRRGALESHRETSPRSWW